VGEALSYTTASGLLKQPDKQKTASLSSTPGKRRSRQCEVLLYFSEFATVRPLSSEPTWSPNFVLWFDRLTSGPEPKVTVPLSGNREQEVK
jgi:hypothetical protein